MSKYIKYIIIVVAIALIAILFFYDPTNAKLAPKCIFKMATGWDCPGCGTSRALYNMVHLNFGAAWKLNPILFFAIPYVLILIWLEIFGGAKKYVKLNKCLTGRNTLIVILIIIILYWIGRNIIL